MSIFLGQALSRNEKTGEQKKDNITLLLNDSETLNHIKNDITDAYAKGKINELHYNLLNKKISDHENNQESIDKKLSSQKITTTSTTHGSPIKINK